MLAGIWRDGVDPRSAGRIAIPVGLDAIHISELAGIVDFFGMGVEDGGDTLAPDLHDAVGLLCGVNHGEAVFHVVGHGLFTVDVFAGSAGIHENSAMLMVGCCDEDGVDILTVENLFVIAGRRNILFDGFLGGDMS